ncbi:hypothetical protein TKK_0010677 [Trichogramma kaykai]
MSKMSLVSLFLGLFLIIAVSNVSANTEGSQLAQQEDFKHQVSIQIICGDRSNHTCSGSILDELNIVTAAHCVTVPKINQLDSRKIVVVAGTADLRDKSSGLRRDVEYIVVPKSYSLRKDNYADIAILKLRNPLPLDTDSRIMAIKLPSANQNSLSDIVVSSFSFFNNYPNGTIVWQTPSPVLRWTFEEINAPDYKDCHVKEICSKPKDSRSVQGACNGDGGAPLVDENTYSLIGVARHLKYELCGKETRYTRVSAYLDFINNVRRINFNDIAYLKL